MLLLPTKLCSLPTQKARLPCNELKTEASQRLSRQMLQMKNPRHTPSYLALIPHIQVPLKPETHVFRIVAEMMLTVFKNLSLFQLPPVRTSMQLLWLMHQLLLRLQCLEVTRRRYHTSSFASSTNTGLRRRSTKGSSMTAVAELVAPTRIQTHQTS